MLGDLWDSVALSPQYPLNLMILGCPLCHLCCLSGCNWILIVVRSFFVGYIPPAGLLEVTPPTTLCILLYRFCQNQATKLRKQTHTSKNNPYAQSHYQQKMSK